MGSTSLQLPPHTKKIDAVRALLSEESRANILAFNVVGSTVYLAIRRPKEPETVDGIVALVSNHRGWTNIKLIEEEMGPYQYDASPEVLAALSPKTNPEALEWRRKCMVARETWQARISGGT